VVLPFTSGDGILEGVVQGLIRRIGKTDQAFRLGDGPAVQTSLNSSGWSLRLSDPALKRSPSAWLGRSLTCSRCDVSPAGLMIRNLFGGGIQRVSPGEPGCCWYTTRCPGTLAVEMNGTTVWW
jgi:hypothetical protein